MFLRYFLIIVDPFETSLSNIGVLRTLSYVYETLLFAKIVKSVLNTLLKGMTFAEHFLNFACLYSEIQACPKFSIQIYQPINLTFRK